MADEREFPAFEVWHWPEFQAFLKRLGVNPPESTSGIVITMVSGETVQVQQTHAPTTTEPLKDYVLCRPDPFSHIKPCEGLRDLPRRAPASPPTTK